MGTDDGIDSNYGDNTKIAGIGELDGKNSASYADELVTASFDPYSNVLYTSYDTACETAYSDVEPCLDKGDMLFVIDSYYYAGEFHTGAVKRPDGSSGSSASHESGNIYTIKKIYKDLQVFTATTGNYDFVASCSNRG